MNKYFIFLLFLLSICNIIPQVETKKFLEGAIITAIEKEGDSIWCATWGHGVFRYSPKNDKWINFSTKSKNLTNDFFHTIAVSKEYVWAGASEGLFIYNRKKDSWTTRKFALGGEMGNWIRYLKYDPQKNNLWIGRFKNLTLLNVRRQSYEDFDLTQNKDPKTNNFISIKLEGDSIIWFGTEAGIHKYYRRKPREINPPGHLLIIRKTVSIMRETLFLSRICSSKKIISGLQQMNSLLKSALISIPEAFTDLTAAISGQGYQSRMVFLLTGFIVLKKQVIGSGQLFINLTE